MTLNGCTLICHKENLIGMEIKKKVFKNFERKLCLNCEVKNVI